MCPIFELNTMKICNLFVHCSHINGKKRCPIEDPLLPTKWFEYNKKEFEKQTNGVCSTVFSFVKFGAKLMMNKIGNGKHSFSKPNKSEVSRENDQN